MGVLISFLCDGCQATLSVPADMAGISGPCPYCGQIIASPQSHHNYLKPASDPPISWSEEVPLPIAPLPRPSSIESAPTRQWLTPQLVATAPEMAKVKRSRLHPALWAAAGLAFFTGGVGLLWKLWEPAKQDIRSIPEKGYASTPPPNAAEIAPPLGVLASADDPPLVETASLPPPSESKPDVILPPTAVARDVSTSRPKAQPVIATAPAAKAPPGTREAGPIDSEAMRSIRKVVPTDGLLAKPGEAIIRFLGAATWQERLPYTLAAEKMKPAIEAYYRHGGDGPIIPEEVQLTRLEATEDDPNLHYYSFIVYLPDRLTGIPLSVEDTRDGTRVEWRTFVECKDSLLAAFCKEPHNNTGTFRALVRRCHYFDKDVPDQEHKQCFEISPPDASTSFYVWANLDSAVYKQHFASGERARWDVSSMMTISLQWEKSESGVAWKKLRDVVSESWHPELLPAGAAR